MTREECRAMFERFYQDMDKPRSPRRERTEGQVARENTRSRLRRLREDLQTAATKLEHLHTYGAIFASYPLLNKEWDGKSYRPGIGARFERARQEAAHGCTLSAEFVAQWEPLFLMCEHMRRERLPEWKPEPTDRGVLTPQMRRLFQNGRGSLAWDAMDEMDDGAD